MNLWLFLKDYAIVIIEEVSQGCGEPEGRGKILDPMKLYHEIKKKKLMDC